jgi:4-hydroxybenzoate polyprenyltransferase
LKTIGLPVSTSNPEPVGAAGSRTHTSAGLSDYLQLIRPAQWVKNVVVFTGPAAGLKLFTAHGLTQSLLTFAAFCLSASAGYIVNDLFDRQADRSHPTKRFRPIAAGRIGIGPAAVLAVILWACAITAASLFASRGVTLVLCLYIVLTLSYSAVFKERIILDVILIAIGFVLRALAGALAVDVPASEWLIVCVFTLCLFMGFGKRRCEIAMIGDAVEIGNHRRTLVRYTPDLLNHLITVSAGIAVITFLLYTMDTGGAHASVFPKQQLFYTLPLVIYGIFRFAMLTELGLYTGPTEIVLKDRAMFLTIVLWTLCALVVAYQGKLLGPGGLHELLV